MDLNSLLSLVVPVLVLPLLYMYTAGTMAGRFPTLRNKRICLLIAHPDDEAMFFAPTVLALTKPDGGNHVKILCLSTGNADGLGETRKKELVKSALALGLRHEDDVFVIDSPDFPDSMATTWDNNAISSLLSSAFAPNLANSSTSLKAKSSSRNNPSTADAPTAAIDVLVTFDQGGVSGHPNHISLYHGARTFVSSLTKGKPGWASPVDLYTLTSVNVARKYLAFLDALPTVLSLLVSGGDSARHRASGERGGGGSNPAALLAMSSLAGGRETYGAARAAMTTAHQSQMVWFRWGWIAFSRYMVINDLRLEHVKV
ncbi:putative deacetylase LmbE-like domain-containing protein [Xylariomycetidae sp. FL0641]|nr:putative deacetylase LmbE-like domain-containing protein [Xylariomycetidae sp. FL0641]